jgi:UDP-N-acetylglucosamine 2-epimerase (non-hydrolysing)
LNEINKKFKKKIVVSLHPRTKKILAKKKFKFNKDIIFSKPLSFTDYVNLQINAKAVLSDSGTISEESSILNFPALNIRESHERPEAMEEGSVMMVGLDKNRILQALEIIANQSRSEDRDLDIPADYTSNNVSKKILRIIMSYTNQVNKRDWLKD